LEIRNGAGLALTLSLDRAADISRLTLDGKNFGYFSPCGYVAPAYYDANGAGFLKSFTAGFLTTCGLRNVGSPCEDAGEALPLHGTISNTPCENVAYWYEKNAIFVKATVVDGAPFAPKMVLTRTYEIPVFGNEMTITDAVENIGSAEAPFQMLYHFNVGYPLLSEKTELSIPATEVAPRNDHAATDIGNCLKMEKPQNGYEEMCFYHKMEGRAEVKVYNPEIGCGFVMSYDTKELPCFTEWKMMGEGEYVLGVEPGNAYPDGRDVMRAKGMLQMIAPGEVKTHSIKFTFLK
jgi:galactose mutarotase-like enzyme